MPPSVSGPAFDVAIVACHAMGGKVLCYVCVGRWHAAVVGSVYGRKVRHVCWVWQCGECQAWCYRKGNGWKHSVCVCGVW